MLKFTIYGLQTYIQQIQNGYIKRSSSAIHSRLDCEMWKRSIKSPWYALSSHSITMWSIVWFGLPRSQPGLGSFLHLWRLWAHTPCPVLIRFKVFHICRGWSKPSGFTTGSMRFLTSGGAFSVQSFCHSDLMLKLLAASCCADIFADFLDRSWFIVRSGISSWIGSYVFSIIFLYSFIRASCLLRAGRGMWLSVGSQ